MISTFFFRIASLHDSLQADFGYMEAARRIIRGALQRYGPPFATAGDLDSVAGILTRASCQRKDFDQTLVAFELVDAGLV